MRLITRRSILLIAPIALVLSACGGPTAQPVPLPTAPAGPIATPTEAAGNVEPGGDSPTEEGGVLEITPLGGEPGATAAEADTTVGLSGGWRVTYFEGTMICGTSEEGAESYTVIPASAEESILITFDEGGGALTADGFGQEDADERVPVAMTRMSQAAGQTVYEGSVTLQEDYILVYTLTLFTEAEARIEGTITGTVEGCEIERPFEAVPVG